MRKTNIIIISTMIGLLIILNYSDIYHYMKDRLAWNNLKLNLTEEKVSTIELSGFQSRKLEPVVQKKFLLILQTAKFKQSNWRKHGPTSEVIISINFHNGTKKTFGYWGGDTFETTYKASQFLISSSQLALLLKEISERGEFGGG